MLRFSTSNDRSVYSSSNVPSNPPLTTILEQCFWGDNSDKYYYIKKYNDRCASRNFNQSRGKSPYLKVRPATTDGRFCDRHSPTSIGAFGEGILQVNSQQDCNDESRSSTPDFMQEVYDAYSNLDIASEQSQLLRRPLSQRSCSSEVQGLGVDLCVKPERSQSVPVISNGDLEINNIDSSSEVEDEISKLSNEKKTVKVAVEIPMCDKAHPDNDIICNGLLIDNGLKYVVETSACDKDDDVQSIRSVKSNDSTKSNTSKPTKRLRTPAKKKKYRPKKKVDVTTISLDLTRAGKSLRIPARPVWKSSDDEVVTQMSALGLTKRPDEELTPKLSRKSSSFDLKSSRSVASSKSSIIKPIVKRIQIEANNISLMPQRRASNSKSRRVPIQIISDPFMGSDSKDVSPLKPGRPRSALPLSSGLQTKPTQCWR